MPTGIAVLIGRRSLCSLLWPEVRVQEPEYAHGDSEAPSAPTVVDAAVLRSWPGGVLAPAATIVREPCAALFAPGRTLLMVGRRGPVNGLLVIISHLSAANDVVVAAEGIVVFPHLDKSNGECLIRFDVVARHARKYFGIPHRFVVVMARPPLFRAVMLLAITHERSSDVNAKIDRVPMHSLDDVLEHAFAIFII